MTRSTLPHQRALRACVIFLFAGCEGAESPLATELQMFEESCELTELLVQIDPAATHQLFPVYRDLAAALDPATRLVVAIPNAGAERSARALLEDAGFAAARCRFLPCDVALSPWARDRLIVVRPPSGPVFFHPTPSLREPDKDTDLAVAPRLAAMFGGHVASGLALDGGNVLAGAGHLFIGSNVLTENNRYYHADVREALRRLFGRKPVLLGESCGVPHQHLDLYLTTTGPNQVLLGDPGAAADLLDQMGADEATIAFGNDVRVFDAARQRQFVPKYEGLRKELQRLGLEVVRVPILHATKTLLTWNNALIERRGGIRRALVPVYGLPRFDRAAIESYEKLGYRVHRIDASRIIGLGGSVRCVTNVVSWRRVRP